jgi:hypothetical protein
VSAPIRFRGAPRSLAAIVSGAAAGGVHTVRINASPAMRAAAPVEAVAVSAAADPVARLSLPSATPPGTYNGRMQVDGGEQDVEIVVEPEVLLRLLPARLVFEASPGERIPFELTLVNSGNVPVDIRGAYAFGLFDIAGPERAIGRLVADPKEGQRRIDAFADAIADEHGGLVRVKVDAGEGVLQPGVATELKITVHVPDRLRGGHTYWGTWPLHNLKYYVRITGKASAPRRGEEQP